MVRAAVHGAMYASWRCRPRLRTSRLEGPESLVPRTRLDYRARQQRSTKWPPLVKSVWFHNAFNADSIAYEYLHQWIKVWQPHTTTGCVKRGHIVSSSLYA